MPLTNSSPVEAGCTFVSVVEQDRQIALRSHPENSGRYAPLFALMIIAAINLLLSGCSRTMDKIEQIGQAPPLSTVQDPTVKPEYQPMSWPTPETQAPPKQYANSLWQPGSRAFFRDQRAARVGDIVKVMIEINDRAQFENKTDRKRESSEDASVTNAAGYESYIGKIFPSAVVAGSLIDAAGNTDTKGEAKVDRRELITTQVAALITQILPNGNMVIEGKQEMLVNYDIREVSIRGVIRPQDITSDNSVDSANIAEARITYGGRGQLMDVQQPRWGHQLMEAVSPF